MLLLGAARPGSRTRLRAPRARKDLRPARLEPEARKLVGTVTYQSSEPGLLGAIPMDVTSTAQFPTPRWGSSPFDDVSRITRREKRGRECQKRYAESDHGADGPSPLFSCPAQFGYHRRAEGARCGCGSRPRSCSSSWPG